MASTKRNHASAYIRVINLARDRGYIAANKAVPLLDSKGKKSQPRPAFSAEEIRELLSYTETWQKSSYTNRTAIMIPLGYSTMVNQAAMQHAKCPIELRINAVSV